MRIAIPITKGQIENHFGKAEEYLFADVDGQEVRSTRVVKSPGHGPGGPPVVFVRDEHVDLVLLWGAPLHARKLFDQYGIRWVLGATGDPRAALDAFLAGTFVPTTHALDGGGPCGCGCTALVDDAAPHAHAH